MITWPKGFARPDPHTWRYKLKGLRIVNVYQTSLLTTGEIPQGLGDYIRGSLSVMQTARRLGLEFDMALQHPLAEWLRPGTQYANTVADIKYIQTERECKAEIDKCRSTHLFVYVHAYPDKVTDAERQFVRARFQPNDAMAAHRAFVYTSLGIFPGEYEVLHIRCGDKHIQDAHRHYATNDPETVEPVPDYIMDKVLDHIQPGCTYVVVSDSAELKRAIQQVANVIVFHSDIVHLGTSEELASKGVRDTLMDFYLISDAARVTAFSTYSHGSGFSQWACELSKVPYTCTLISP